MMHSVYLRQADEALVIGGQKKQTFMRSDLFDVQPDDRLKLIVSGYRCIRHTRCDESHYIYIGSNRTIIIDDRLLTWAAANEFAKDLGFTSYADFFEQFKQENKLPFEGQVVRWL